MIKLYLSKIKKAVIYRAAEIAHTKKGLENKKALEFVDFIKSKEAQKVWKKYTWKELK